jgi:hypothetical protein
MIPGADLLAMALSVLQPASVQFYPFVSRSVNDIGMEVSTYGEPVTLEGSVQALPRTEYERLGLDLAREYVTFFAQADMRSSGRDRENDYLAWSGAKWGIVNVTAWYEVDGWSEVLAVKIGPLS